MLILGLALIATGLALAYLAGKDAGDRAVWQAHITLTDVRVPETNRLPQARKRPRCLPQPRPRRDCGRASAAVRALEDAAPRIQLRVDQAKAALAGRVDGAPSAGEGPAWSPLHGRARIRQRAGRRLAAVGEPHPG